MTSALTSWPFGLAPKGIFLSLRQPTFRCLNSRIYGFRISRDRRFVRVRPKRLPLSAISSRGFPAQTSFARLLTACSESRPAIFDIA